MCKFCCGNYECMNCCKVEWDIDGFEIKCDGKCSKCICNKCGEENGENK